MFWAPLEYDNSVEHRVNNNSIFCTRRHHQGFVRWLHELMPISPSHPPQWHIRARRGIPLREERTFKRCCLKLGYCGAMWWSLTCQKPRGTGIRGISWFEGQVEKSQQQLHVVHRISAMVFRRVVYLVLHVDHCGSDSKFFAKIIIGVCGLFVDIISD